MDSKKRYSVWYEGEYSPRLYCGRQEDQFHRTYTDLFQAKVAACIVSETHNRTAWVIECDEDDYKRKDGPILFKTDS